MPEKMPPALVALLASVKVTIRIPHRYVRRPN